MIFVDFLTLPDGRGVGFRVAGHSGYAEQGMDIVCASVSSAAYLTVNTLTEVLHISPLALRAEDGEMFFRVEEKDELACRNFLSGLRLHLTELESQYSQYLKVNYLEL